MIDQFENWLKFEKRYSVHTQKSYLSDLLQFRDYLSEKYTDTKPEEATRSMIKSWIMVLMDKKLTPTSIDRKIVTLRVFYKFLNKEGILDQNPAKTLKAPKKGKRIVKFLEEEEILNVLDKFEFTNDFTGKRDKLILEMLYGTGMRLSELIGLKIKNVEPGSKILKVLGKRSKERIIPINNSLLLLIDDYMPERKAVTREKESEFLFVTEQNEPLYPMLVYRVVKKYVDQAVARTHVSPHVLRHSFATHLLNRGADINAIKELLGHSNLAATQIYTHTTVERLKDVYKQAHPRG